MLKALVWQQQEQKKRLDGLCNVIKIILPIMYEKIQKVNKQLLYTNKYLL